jgi:hypothetical protein
MNRTGISNDATLANVYLFDGAKRVTDAASVSLSKITFNDPSGLFMIPAGGMKTISVKADITASTNGQIIGVSLAAVEGSVAVSGAFPILGNNHSIATATMAGVNFNNATTPTGTNVAVDPQIDFTMWQNTVSFTTRAVKMTTMTFRQIGSVATGDLGNFKLMVDGQQVGTTVVAMDANGYITFDLTATPKTIETGSHTFKLMGDIIGGSTKTFSLSLQQAGDAVFMDSQLNQAVLAQANSTTFSARTAGSHLVNAGTLTITKKSDTPSGNITLNGTNVLLSKFEIKAAGEPIKIESLRITDTGTTSAAYSLRNGALFADGVQVGNTASILGGTTGVDYTQFNLGSSLVVTPGTPVILEVRADVYNDYSGGAAIISGNAINASIYAGDNNWKRTKSLTYSSNIAVPANSLTVTVGALSGSKNASYASQTVVVPQTAKKIAAFSVVSTQVENINLDTIALVFTGTNTEVDTGLTDVYVKYGAKTSSIKATVATSTTWSVSETLLPNTTMLVEVYANLTSSLVSTNTLITNLEASGTTANSATTVTTGAMNTTTGVGGIAGQTMTVSTGTIKSEAVTDSSLNTKLLVGNTTPKVASFRFLATNDTYTITDIGVSVAAAAQGSFRDITLKSSGMTDRIITLNGSYATSSGLTLTVPANNSAGTVVDVYANLNDIGEAAATSSTDIKVTLSAFKALTSGGTETYGDDTGDAAGQSMFVFKSLPTITLVTLPSTILRTGTQTLMKFTIASDSAGSIGWKKINFTIAKTAAVDIGATSTFHLYDAAGTEIGGLFATSTATAPEVAAFAIGGTGGTIQFEATNEQQISTSETYSLKATIVDGTASGKSISTSIASPNATTHSASKAYVNVAGTLGDTADSSFTWTDRSSNNHGVATPDWNDDYKVKNLPTDTQTMSGQT